VIGQPKGSRVSQLFTRSTSPESQASVNPTLKSAHSANDLANPKVDAVTKEATYRKPFGCAVLDLSKIFRDSSQELGTDHIMPIFVSSQDHDFYKLHERIIESTTNKLYLL
jgi:hypothetical protein